jgi:hypothetical protein
LQNQFRTQPQITNANHGPIANAGISQTVVGGTTVTLDGRSSYDPNGGKIAAYSWTQVPSSGGVQVTLAGANTANPTFTAPIVPNGNTITLTFSLRVMDSQANLVSTNPAIVYVFVKPFNFGGVAPPSLSSTGPIANLPIQPANPSNGNVLFGSRLR